MSGQVEVIFEGDLYGDWLSYDVDNDLRRPAGAFSLSVRGPADSATGPLTPGGIAELQVEGATVSIGRVDEVPTSRDRTSLTAQLVGRDYGGLLVDASADPSWRWRQRTLSEVVTTITQYVGMAAFPTVEYSPVLQSVKVEPGESCWQLLERLVEAEGLRMWVAPDGHLEISQYMTAGSSVARLIRGKDVASNIVSSSVTRSTGDGASEYAVLGQWDTGSGHQRFRGEYIDTSYPYFRPRVIVADVKGRADAKAHAERLGTQAKADRIDIAYTLRGHLDDQGAPWTVNTLVDVSDELEQIEGSYLIVGRTLRRSRDEGTTTELRLRRPGDFAVAT